MKISKKLTNKIKKIKLIICDDDGVLTDGSIILNDAGIETKRYDVKDGTGIKLAMFSGLQVCVLSGRDSKVLRHRAKELGIEKVYQGNIKKKEEFIKILRDYHLKPDEVAFIGDDVIDLPVIEEVGFSVAVRDANSGIKKRVDFITKAKGGHGAVREVIDIILRVQSKLKKAYERYY